MNDERHRVRAFVEMWARRVLTISGCLVIWLFLLALFPFLLIGGAIIDLARGQLSRNIESPIRHRRTWVHHPKGLVV